VNAPWVVDEGGLLRGPEPLFVENLARDLGARVQWVRGPEATLLKALHERELDLVIGGLTDDSPWQTEVALTRPYASKDKDHFVIAASPGENAWLVHVERALEHQRPSMQAALQGEGP
jgi:polar amino acid transport system substrate-binding protein